MNGWLRPRWRKVWHDLVGNFSRTMLVVLSIAVGIFSIGVIIGAYVIISNDMSASYAANHPMNLDLHTTPFGEDLANAVRRVRGVEDAEARRIFSMRVRHLDGPWVTLNLVAVDDFETMSINLLNSLEGAARPAEHEVLLERQVLDEIDVAIGDVLEFELPDGGSTTLTVAGIVQDPATGAGDFLAQPFAYVAAEELATLGQPATFNRLFVTASQAERNDLDALGALLTRVRDRVEKGGVAVVLSRITKTDEHPMASTVQAILGILLALGVLILFLSSSLIANTLTALLNQHLRHIGVMKLVGARREQVLRMYFTLITAFGVIALLIAVPLGGQGAYALAAFIGSQVNFNLLGYRIIPLAFLVQIVVGLAVPLLAGLAPVLNGSRITVLRALSGDMAADESRPPTDLQGPSRWERFQAAVTVALARRGVHIPRPMLISLRNTFRRRSRLMLTLFTLTMGGAIFVAVFNVRTTLHDYIDQISDYFLADVTLDFTQPYRLNRVEQTALQVPGVVAVEGWAYAGAEVLYADGSTAENITILAPPADSQLVSPLLVSGRWLLPGDQKAIAVSESIVEKFPGLSPGDTLRLKINGREDVWQVVGVFKFVDQQGVIAYSTYEYISRLTHSANRSFTYRIVTAQHDPAYQTMVAEKVDEHFRARGFHVNQARTGQSTLEVASESLDILVTFLLIMALLTALVGSIGLTGTMGMNVLERTREIGVMRSIGAGDAAIIRTVIVEGMVIGGLSWLLGALVSFPITYGLSYIISLAVFQSPIAVHFTFTGFLIWLLVVLALSAVASVLPARNAARLTIREVLAYE